MEIFVESCENLLSERQNLTIERLKEHLEILLERFDENGDEFYLKLMSTLKKIRRKWLVQNGIIESELFQLIEKRLIRMFNEWRRKDLTKEKFSKNEENLFGDLIDLFWKLIEFVVESEEILQLKSFENYFLNESLFVEFGLLMDDIAHNSSRYENEMGFFENVNLFLRTIQWYQSDHDEIRNDPIVLSLVPSIVRGLSSSTYFQLFQRLSIDREEENALEEYFLQRLPCYTIWNRGQAQQIILEQLFSLDLFQSYQNLYEIHLSTIQLWNSSLDQSIFHLTALFRYFAFYSSTRTFLQKNSSIIDSILNLLHCSHFIENVLLTLDYNPQTNIIDSCLSFLFNLTMDSDNFTLLNEKTLFNKDIFLQLTKSRIDRIRLVSFMILAKILDEKDLQQLDQAEKFISVLMNYLTKASEDRHQTFEDVPIEHLLSSLKAFIQHEQIKEEIWKGNYLNFLLRCVNEKDLHRGCVLQLALEIIWALIFHEKIRQLLILNHQTFVNDLKRNLIQSEDENICQAAKGILWQLENEKNLSSQICDQRERRNRYDFMISYSHGNKDLSHRIYDELIRLNFRVWLDKENMSGSTIESMADAIESSSIVLICMSNSYKQSPYCRSEAEYAYARQRQIIPLILEEKYRPDGWLGFICASKLYVDFTKTDFSSAFQKLLIQIEFCREKISNSISSKNSLKIEKNEEIILSHQQIVSTSIIEINRQEEKEKKMFLPIDDLKDLGEIKDWTHDDLLHFLDFHQFHCLKILFSNEKRFDGKCLIQLSRQSRRNPQLIYQFFQNELIQNHQEYLSYLTFTNFLTQIENYQRSNRFRLFFRRFFFLCFTKNEEE